MTNKILLFEFFYHDKHRSVSENSTRRLIFYLLLSVVRDNLTCLYRNENNKHLPRSQHEGIFAAIKNRDTQAAFDAMRQHIVFVMDSVKDARLS